jgi:hypothetical protein
MKMISNLTFPEKAKIAVPTNMTLTMQYNRFSVLLFGTKKNYQSTSIPRASPPTRVKTCSDARLIF